MHFKIDETVYYVKLFIEIQKFLTFRVGTLKNF